MACPSSNISRKQGFEVCSSLLVGRERNKFRKFRKFRSDLARATWTFSLYNGHYFYESQAHRHRDARRSHNLNQVTGDSHPFSGFGLFLRQSVARNTTDPFGVSGLWHLPVLQY